MIAPSHKVLENEPAERAAIRPLTFVQLTWSLVAGGAETYAYNLARGLRNRGHRPIMCALDPGGALEDEIKQANIPCVVMGRKQGIDLKLFWRLWRLFRAIRPDVVHTHHFNQLFYGGIGARLAGARVIHTEHSVELYRRRRFRFALRILSLLCDSITVVGNEGARVIADIVDTAPSRVKIVPGGIDCSQFHHSRSDARARLGIGSDEKVAVIVARLYPEKNHRVLLEAFSIVARKNDRARLLVVGDGIERHNIDLWVAELGLQSRVRVLGVRRDIPQLLAASDVFVLSSDREGLPIAVLEAMAAGLPVVATAVGDLPDLITDGATGRLVMPRDVSALAAALQDVLTNDVAARVIGDSGRKRVTETYALSSLISRYEALYRSFG